jgi:hypothetical protein
VVPKQRMLFGSSHLCSRAATPNLPFLAQPSFADDPE